MMKPSATFLQEHKKLINRHNIMEFLFLLDFRRGYLHNVPLIILISKKILLMDQLYMLQVIIYTSILQKMMDFQPQVQSHFLRSEESLSKNIALSLFQIAMSVLRTEENHDLFKMYH